MISAPPDPARAFRAARAALLALPAFACAAPEADDELPIVVPDAFAAPGGAERDARWWTAFGDAELDRIVEEALAGNLDLEAAWRRLAEARAVAEREAAFLLPEVEAFGEGLVRRPEQTDGETLGAGLAASYEVDLWGRVEARADAERFRARATLAEYRTLAVSLSAEVALAWFRLVEARGQRDLLAEQTATNEQVLDLIEARFGTGQVRRTDLLRQRQLVESTRALGIEAEARVEVLEHLLAVLLGRPPRAAPDVARGALPEPPPLPRTGVPAELVRRRPDLVRAHALLAAADRDLAAAVADRYPRLDLTASLATTDEGSDELFQDWIRSLAADLVGPVFDAGRRRAEVDRAAAARERRLLEYAQSTLLAFREVEDALALERKQAERIASLERQVDLAERAAERLQDEYLFGVGSYLDVLDARTALQELRREALAARLTRLEQRVALHRALAGGFETAREVAP